MAGRWLLLGDSHLEAIGPRLRPLLAPRGITTRAIVRRGQGVSSFVDDEEVFRAVQELRPDATIIFLGGNDGRDDPEYQAKVRRLLSQVPNPVWVGPWFASDSAVQRRHLRADGEIRSAASRAGIPYLNGQAFSPRAQLAPDGVHYTQAGYATIAERIAPALLNAASSSFPWLPLVAGLGIGAALTWWALQ